MLIRGGVSGAPTNCQASLANVVRACSSRQDPYSSQGPHLFPRRHAKVRSALFPDFPSAAVDDFLAVSRVVQTGTLAIQLALTGPRELRSSFSPLHICRSEAAI